MYKKIVILFAFSTAVIFGQMPVFSPVAADFTTDSLIIPQEYRYSILFRVGDKITAPDGTTTEAREKLDYLCFFPAYDLPNKGFLFVNHETKGPHPVLGDGGAMTRLMVKAGGKGWMRPAKKNAVDFSNVGGTWINCSGGDTLTGNNTIFTCEEYEPFSNQDLIKAGWTDTSDYMGSKRYLNYGFMVEVDPGSAKAIAKHYAMGRFSHEAALIMPDGKTVYMTDDYSPGVFFKFIADAENDYSKGILYAYKQTEQGGEWLPLPRDREALNNARETALKMGASIFIRIEDIGRDSDGMIYITETGLDETDLGNAIALGGNVAAHLNPLRKQGTKIYNDYFGRILKFDPVTNKIEVYLEAGSGGTTGNHLANPDNIAIDRKRNVMVICEDINGFSKGRNPKDAVNNGAINELYLLDLSIKNPAVDDLKRFLIGPAGCELTGPYFNLNYSTLFLNLQHPSDKNKEPFNKGVTVAIDLKK